MTTRLYARVSTSQQGEKFGLSSQLSELRVPAKRHDRPIQEYTDTITGSEDSRPGLNRMIADAQPGDVILVHHPDRLSRGGVVHQFLIEEAVLKTGATIEYLLLPRGSQGEAEWILQKTQMASFAEYERAKIKERTMRGKLEAARRGFLPHGRAPFGYRRSTTEPGKLVIHDDEARVIRLLFTMLLDEQRSLWQITQALDRNGHPAPQGSRWVSSTVKRLVTSEVYAGRMVWNRWAWSGRTRRQRPESEWIPITVPAIVQPWQVERAQAQLQRNKALWSGRPTPRFYLLRGLLICGACGRPWHGSVSHGRRRYRCASRDRAFYAESCESPSWKAERLETIIWETVTGILRNPDLLESKLGAYRATVGVRDVEIRSDAAHVARQIATLDRQERKILDLYLDEEVDSPAVRIKVTEIATRRQVLTARAEALRVRIVTEEAAASRRDSVKAFCETVLKGLGVLTQDGRRRLLLALVDRVVVSQDRVELHGVLPGTLAGISMTGVTAAWAPTLTATAVASQAGQPFAASQLVMEGVR